MDITPFINEHNIILAPMAGVSDSAFREICRSMGARLTYTEMISAKALTYKDRRTFELLPKGDSEAPIIIQIFGHEPGVIAEAAKVVEQYGPAAIDINMGCPTPKIVNNFDGCYLMRDLTLASKIIESAVKGVCVPVTVKFRKGWDDQTVNAVEFAKMAENSGAAAVCIHGRTRSQFYSLPVDIQIIADIKAQLKIPVIANGGITSAETALEMFNKTKCNAVMIGRGAMGNPFIFKEISEFLKTGTKRPAPNIDMRIQLIRRHIYLMIERKGEHNAMREARKHVSWYFKGIRGSSVIKEMANRLTTANDLEKLLDVALSLDK